MTLFISPPIAANCDLDGCQFATLEAENRTIFNSLEKANANAAKLRTALAEALAAMGEIKWCKLESAEQTLLWIQDRAAVVLAKHKDSTHDK